LKFYHRVFISVKGSEQGGAEQESRAKTTETQRKENKNKLFGGKTESGKGEIASFFAMTTITEIASSQEDAGMILFARGDPPWK